MKRLLWIGGVGALLILAGIAYVLRPSVAASSPIEAIPLEVATSTTTIEANATETNVPEEIAAPAESTTGGETAFVATGTVVFVISQDESEASFSIDEILSGSPKTAIGVTNQVAGEIAINFDDPTKSQIGAITVNARTLQTDDENRNRMIRNEILDTAAYELITFTPTTVTGLPATFAAGQTVEFQVSGDLTIREITVPVTFDVTATVDASGRLSGQASTTVLRSDFGLVIPSVPKVANVSDEVILEIDFVADPKQP